ncbi:MAG: TauD/TfdA family dioxygenase [Myxococcota bacterium]|nr:TauD/TfdA family dioxygenase [Myxococcota bacterium]
METVDLRTEKLTSALGAEVTGADFTQPISAELKKAVHEALLEHRVLFFRDQDLTPEQHKAVGRCFGELHVHPVIPSRKDEGHPEIVVLESGPQLPFVADRWHSDVSFERKPPLGSILRGVVIPDHGGDTMWANMTAAYDALSDSMQRLLSGLQAENDGTLFSGVADDAQRKELAKDQTTTHPIIRTHPETGRKGIYVNSTFTTKIVDMKRNESRALLSFLYDHIASPEFHCRFRWRKNSMAIWDNRCTQHRVVSDDIRAHRRVERVTVIGDEPF